MMYLTLFYEFFKIGLFAIGGGLATLPFLYDLAARHPDWYTVSELVDMVAVSESTPGPMGVNMSTYVGFSSGGVLGGFCSTMGLIAPSIIVILIVAKLLEKFKSSKIVQDTFYGIRPASMGLIAAAAILVMKEALVDMEALKAGNIIGFFNVKAIVFCILLLIALKKINLHPVFFIAIAAAAGCIFKF